VEASAAEPLEKPLAISERRAVHREPRR
jgi:hypothetical protein